MQISASVAHPFWSTTDSRIYGLCTPPVAWCFCICGGWPTRVTSTASHWWGFNLLTDRGIKPLTRTPGASTNWLDVDHLLTMSARGAAAPCAQALSCVVSAVYRRNVVQRFTASISSASYCRRKSFGWGLHVFAGQRWEDAEEVSFASSAFLATYFSNTM